MLKVRQLFVNALNKTSHSELCFNLHPLISCKNLKKCKSQETPFFVSSRSEQKILPQAMLLTAMYMAVHGKSIAFLDKKKSDR